MAASRWMFTKEQLQNTPSRKSGIDADKELSYRQQGANLIQDMGQRLSVTQLCINTAIVYMHRFYMFQSFHKFPRNEMSPAALFLAAKVEEQPRKLEHVIKVAHSCLHRDNTPAPDTKSEAYLEQAQQLVINENILLQTLGFEVTVDHPHTHIVKAVTLVKATKDLAQTSYFLATNSLHMTTFSLQYRPTIVACSCIYLACKWSNWKIPRSNEGREWFQYVDRSVTSDLLEELYTEFIAILEKYPHKLRKKIMGWKGDKDGNAREEECVINFDRRHRPESHTSHTSTSQDKNRPSQAQHKPTNHDRKEASKDSKDVKTDIKHAHDHRKFMGVDRKDGHGSSDKKPGAVERKDVNDASVHSEKKEFLPEGHDKFHRKEFKSERKDLHGHGERKDQLHQQRKLHPEKREHGEHRERLERKPVPKDHRDSPSIKIEPESETRSQNSSNTFNAQKTKVEFEIGAPESVTVKKEPGIMIPPKLPPGIAAAQQGGELRKVKSDQAIHYKDYLKRKEQEREKMERERHERQKLEQERLEKMKLEQERMRKEKAEKEKQEALITVKQEPVEQDVTDGLDREKLQQQKSDTQVIKKPNPYGPDKDRKHRPPKLDISAHVRGGHGGEMRGSEKDHNERPYEVNIKSPVKPHHNITVKSPIKSSDLKQPRLEITKVLLAPDRDGSDSCSVNINSDPTLKKMVEPSTAEPGVSNSKSSSHQVDPTKIKIKTEPSETVQIKQERPDSKVKMKQKPADPEGTDVDAKPEQSAPATGKTRDPGHEPQNGNIDEPQGGLKISIKQEKDGSGRSTPVVNQVKSETGSGSNTPIRTKIVLPTAGENSPLKLKISTKSLHPDLSPANAEKHRSPHRHHKHKDKHKSHKHSKDREKHRDRHREKHAEKHGGSSSSGTNGHPLKMSIKLSDIHGHSSSSNDSWVVKHKHDKPKHKSSVSETALNRNLNSSEAERQQPWSMSDLLTKSKEGVSPARKRRRTPTVDVNSDSSHPKSAKTDSHGHRLRRSSSSHSVVSMEMSDGEDGHGQDGVVNQSQVANQLQESLQQMIDQTKRNVLALQQKQKKQPKSVSNSHDSRRPAVIDRQQSGFDLEGMMWSSGGSDGPPLPHEARPPLPKYPPSSAVPPPPPE